ncbi:hypothetical protein [Rhodococcus sp. JT-3]|uniref:hypothetical protein n=1 Tax=Rhodococcus sp. JT-3 TaxID=1973213 RepID=UPI001303D5D7|nr:hypothetical protein [Rhodococcus sp. JT-3]
MSDGERVHIRPGTRLDARQKQIPATGTAFDIDGCVIEPIGSEELGEVGRSGKVSGIKIYPPGPVERAITSADVVDARGQEWQVEGDADLWIDEDPDLSGPVIVAKRAMG